MNEQWTLHLLHSLLMLVNIITVVHVCSQCITNVNKQTCDGNALVNAQININ